MKTNVADIAKQYVVKLMGVSKEYREKIDTAKTQTKKRYFHKKLQKNNVELSKALIMLESLHNIEKKQQSEEPVLETI